MAFGLFALVPLDCAAQQPILEVRLVGVGQILVEGRLTTEGTLELPVRPLEELTGERLGDVPFLTLAGLAEAFGSQVDVEYRPRLALLQLRDPLATLKATRDLRDRRVAEARATPQGYAITGPYGALTTDLDGGRLVEAGWTFGRIAINGAHSSIGGARWGISVRPFAHTWLSYSDGDTRRRAVLGLRWAGGRTFVQSTYSPDDGDFRGQAATSVGNWTAFVQDDGNAAITYRGELNVTVARVQDGFATRLSFGRNPSPLMLPRVR